MKLICTAFLPLICLSICYSQNVSTNTDIRQLTFKERYFFNLQVDKINLDIDQNATLVYLKEFYPAKFKTYNENEFSRNEIFVNTKDELLEGINNLDFKKSYYTVIKSYFGEYDNKLKGFPLTHPFRSIPSEGRIMNLHAFPTFVNVEKENAKALIYNNTSVKTGNVTREAYYKFFYTIDSFKLKINDPGQLQLVAYKIEIWGDKGCQTKFIGTLLPFDNGIYQIPFYLNYKYSEEYVGLFTIKNGKLMNPVPYFAPNYLVKPKGTCEFYDFYHLAPNGSSITYNYDNRLTSFTYSEFMGGQLVCSLKYLYQADGSFIKDVAGMKAQTTTKCSVDNNIINNYLLIERVGFENTNLDTTLKLLGIKYNSKFIESFAKPDFSFLFRYVTIKHGNYANGKLEINNVTNSNYLLFSPDDLAYSSTYSYEVKVNLEETRPMGAVGLLFNVKDSLNYNYFAITKSNEYVFGVVIKGIDYPRLPLSIIPFKLEPSLNLIRIDFIESKLLISINQTVICLVTPEIPIGKRVGIYLSNNTKATFDDFIIRN